MDCAIPEPSADNDFCIGQALLITQSFQHFTGRPLVAAKETPSALAHGLYHAPFAVLAHEAAADPIFTYANLTAQHLFEMPWRIIVGMPSRRSAEPMLRDARQQLLERVAQHGYIHDYEGIRVARSGKRFRVCHATVWNLLDASCTPVGQAATFADWTLL